MGIKNKIFDKFTEEVCSQIKCSEVHSDIKAEMDCHLEEIKEAFYYSYYISYVFIANI